MLDVLNTDRGLPLFSMHLEEVKLEEAIDPLFVT
jgi:hypothetical protein